MLLAERAARSPRLRQVVSVPLNPFKAPQWVPDPNFHAPRHVRVHEVGGGAGAVERLAASLMAGPLHRGCRPGNCTYCSGPAAPRRASTC
ncbi:wax ester/triacylglycerol synthase domain-containing protein [Streptacidiphilus monticola]